MDRAQPQPDPPDDDVSAAGPVYAQVPRIYGRETTYALTRDALTISDIRQTTTVALSTIVSVRMTYEPKTTHAAFRTTLTLANGRSLSITNLSFKSLVDVEKRDDRYRAFIEPLFAAIGRASPACVWQAGKSRKLWLASVVLSSGLMFGIVMLLPIALRGGTHWAFAVSIVLFAVYFGWMSWQMVSRNRPRLFTPDTVPQDLLP